MPYTRTCPCGATEPTHYLSHRCPLRGWPNVGDKVTHHGRTGVVQMIHADPVFNHASVRFEGHITPTWLPIGELTE